MLFEHILVEFDELLVNILLKLHSNSCGVNLYISDDVWVIILIQFEALSQPFTFYLQVANMVNVVIHLH